MRRLLIFLLLLAIPIYAETNGTINFNYTNATTGLYGYTVGLCNATSDCYHYRCFLDYDGSYLGSVGLCNATAVTNCFHDGSAYALGTYACRTNTTYHLCGSSGVWSNETACSSGACVGGTTACSASSGSGSGGGSQSNITVDLTPSIIFSSFPSDFELVQGASTTKTVTVKNDGNQTLYNVTLSVAGINWYTVSPSNASTLSRNGEAIFNLTFSAPENAETKTYTLTFVIHSHNASRTKSVQMIVKASEQTAQDVIIPDYAKYAALLAELKVNASALSAAGANVEEINNLLLNAESKLKQVSTAIDAKDYSTAVAYTDDARGLLNAAAAKLQALKPPPFHLDPVVLVAILIAIAAAAFVIYLLLPPKDESRRFSDYFGKVRKKIKKQKIKR